MGYFERDFAWIGERFNLNPISPGEIIDLPDATFEVVKTNHTPDSVGFIITNTRRSFAYLVDGIIPPEQTIKRIIVSKLDFLILEGTLDKLILPEGIQWENFSITEAVEFWQSCNIPELILTHISCHSWNIDKLIAGLSNQERRSFEKDNPGIKFAYDGLSLEI